MKSTQIAQDVDRYIANQEADQQEVLTQLRERIAQLVPEAEQLISYGMPAFKFKGLLVWYAATSKHYGLYPKAAPIVQFAAELKNYDCSKGTIRFPRGSALPWKLIDRIVKFCVEQNIQQEKDKAMKSAKSTKSAKSLSSSAASKKSLPVKPAKTAKTAETAKASKTVKSASAKKASKKSALTKAASKRS